MLNIFITECSSSEGSKFKILFKLFIKYMQKIGLFNKKPTKVYTGQLWILLIKNDRSDLIKILQKVENKEPGYGSIVVPEGGFIEDEKIKVVLRERRKQVPATSGSFYRFDTAYAGELQFNVFNEYERVISTFKDTPRTRIEDKIISIVATLEIRSKTIKEDRIEAERIRIKREKEELERQQFKEKRKQEYHEFLSLFSMAERLHKTFILRQYISTYEDFVKKSNGMNEEIAAKIKWAREKADWLDPFINKEDLYMDHYNKDEIIQPECPKQNMWDNPGYRSSTGDTFWSRKYKFGR